MIDLLRRSAVPIAVAITSILLIGCAGTGSGASPSALGSSAPAATTLPAGSEAPATSGAPAATASGAPAATASDAPASASSPVPEGAAIPPGTPTGCVGLGPEDCERARAFAATVLEPGDPAVVYVQVGPFGCLEGERCPTNLLTRPQGDVTIEFGGGSGINVHLTVAPDGSFQAERQEAMGIAVPPASPPDGIAGPREFTLGHCGVFSGIDVDGSYWDLVGPISFDSGEAINATTGILNLTDPNHGTFSAPGGFSVQLIRHVGPKLLPMCM
jgi:hypothetical protein